MDGKKTISPFDSLAAAISVLGEAGNKVLRAGIRSNLATFPAQVPTFKKVTRPDVQAKIATLYFVRGWSMSEIGDRYRLGRQRVGQILTQWRIRAVGHGYVQVIDQAALIPYGQLEEPYGEAEAHTLHGPSANGTDRSETFRKTATENAIEICDGACISVEAAPDLSGLQGAEAPSGSELLLLEELESIIGVLENQLTLCSKEKFVSALDSCKQLFDRGKALCAVLAPNLNLTSSNLINLEQSYDRRRLRKAVKSAKALIRRASKGKSAAATTKSVRTAARVFEANVPERPSKRTHRRRQHQTEKELWLA